MSPIGVPRAPDPGGERWLAERRRRRVRALILPGGVVVALVLLGLVIHPPVRIGALAVPTDPTIASDGRGDTGDLQGVLRASRSGRTACFWVDGPHGRAYVVSPPGWTADAQLRLLDTGGRVVAAPGQRRLFEGSPGPVRSIPGCPTADRVWRTSSVVRASSNFDRATLPPP